MKQRDNAEADTWQQLAAPTAKLLEKQRPDKDREPDEGKRTPVDAERKAERREISIRGIMRDRRQRK